MIRRLLDRDALVEFINTGTESVAVTDSTNLASVRFTAQEFQDRIVRITSGNAHGSISYARVLSNGSGRLTVSPAFSAALANGVTGELWSHKFHPDDVDIAIDAVLSEDCTRARLVPLSWFTDGDMVETAATAWDQSSATVSKVKQSGAQRFAERTLRVQGNSGTYAGQVVNVKEGDKWRVFALARADAGGGSLYPVNVSGMTAIPVTPRPLQQWSGEAFQLLGIEFDIPVGVEEMLLQLRMTAAGSDVYFGQLGGYPVDAREFVLPSRIVSASKVGRFYYFDGEEWPQIGMPKLLPRQPRVVDVGGGNVKVYLHDDPGSRMIFFEEYAHYPALRTAYNTRQARAAGDAAETDCPLEYVAWGVMRRLFPGQFEAEWARVSQEFGARPVVRMSRPAGRVWA
jgi:hypothetical protein